ncbi:glutathione-specific gamma-glutamylcyclotransferase 1 [Malaya genurostris]|uniref:glutathione-specific gamma-glutamylcyclotransferase 1 n=1 Tax=Malaya genurostris TaxID=325434 RepID=UPI0026F3FE4D|nr:glutathione-specific gamma-glutamylcyclotransferase 1 [Malaya genurostris]XP_058456579.1 glutathione-specific gamma-glutamylcyclotransferase 1 [Malaya genurostris]
MAAVDSRSDRRPNTGEPSVWIFGYGSLCWYPGFEYDKCITGYIRGYVRRFWQGNTTHRGTKDKGITWGCAFRVTGNLALDYLRQRECTLGGYSVDYIKFFPRVASEHSGISGEAFLALVYVATPKNEHWIGEEPMVETARQITQCAGPSGHNVEYLIRLAVFMREELPGASDEHLFELEGLVRRFVAEANVPIGSLLGSTPRRIRRDSHEEIRRHVSFEYTSRVPEKKLRCLNI